MSKKKELKKEELDKANGCARYRDGATSKCSKCDTRVYPKDCVKIGSGCDTHTHYTCPNCGNEWDED